MIAVGDAVDVRQGPDWLVHNAEVLHVPVATGDAWGFRSRQYKNEIWTTEPITIYKKATPPTQPEAGSTDAALRALVKAATEACDHWDGNMEKGIHPQVGMTTFLRRVRAALSDLTDFEKQNPMEKAE